MLHIIQHIKCPNLSAENKVSYSGNNGFDYWFASQGNMATATPNCACQAFENDLDFKETYVGSL